MGRPPIGKRAMTGAERTRRYREKAHPKPAGPQAPVARLQARIHELEAEIEKLHVEVTRFMRAWSGSWTVVQARVGELEAEKLASERRVREVDPDSLPKSYRKKYEAARRRLERAFEDRVKREAHRRLDELFLPSFERQDAHCALDRRDPLVVTGYQSAADRILGPASKTRAGVSRRALA
jgi:hypothetical protein